jgi:aminopeptidase C
MVSICLGSPPKTFTWEYYDKDKAYHKVGPITPLDFYKQLVKPVFNMEDKVGIHVCAGLQLSMELDPEQDRPALREAQKS